MQGASQRIQDEVGAWEGIAIQPHRFGGVEFAMGRREIGHLHGDNLLDIPFPRKVGEALVAEGVALEHRFMPDSGWVSFPIKNEQDIEIGIDLLRRSYEIALKQKGKRGD